MLRSIEIRPYVWEGAYAEYRNTAPHDASLCADVRAPWMAAGERLILRGCEMIGYPEGYFYDDHLPTYDPEGRGRDYHHVTFEWDASKSPESLSADCLAEGKGRFTVDLRAEADYVDIFLSIRNDMDKPVGPIDWPFCVIALESPTLRNPENDRIFVSDGKRLRSFLDINGAAGTVILPVAGGDGFIPDVHSSIPHGSFEVQESVVITESACGKYAAALGFDQSYSSYFSPGNLCFHMDPYFGVLDSREHKTMRGRLYMIEGNAQDAWERYRQDFRT